MNWKSISNSQYSKLLGQLETASNDGKDFYRMFVNNTHLNSGNFELNIGNKFPSFSATYLPFAPSADI